MKHFFIKSNDFVNDTGKIVQKLIRRKNTLVLHDSLHWLNKFLTHIKCPIYYFIRNYTKNLYCESNCNVANQNNLYLLNMKIKVASDKRHDDI